jgi:hypothetical protein
MRRGPALLVLALAVAAGACKGEETAAEDQSIVVIHVTFGSNVPAMYQIRVNAHLGSGGVDSVLTFPNTATDRTIQSGDTLALLIPTSRTGTVDLNISGLNRDGQVVAAGTGQAMIVVGEQVDKTIVLSPL